MPTRARLQRQISDLGTIYTELLFEQVPGGGVAPAFLFDLSGLPARPSLFIMEWVTSIGECCCFETRGSAAPPLTLGKEYGFQQIWTPLAFDIVADVSVTWQPRVYLDVVEHDHCPLSHEKLSAQTAAFWSAKYGWISSTAYHEDILRDQYGVRERIKQGRRFVGD